MSIPRSRWGELTADLMTKKAETIFKLTKNLYFVNDEVGAGCPKLGHTTLGYPWLTSTVCSGETVFDIDQNFELTM